MVLQDFGGLVEEILQVDHGTVARTSTRDGLGSDSLAHITFVAEVNSELQISVGADQLAGSETVADFFKLISGGK